MFKVSLHMILPGAIPPDRVLAAIAVAILTVSCASPGSPIGKADRTLEPMTRTADFDHTHQAFDRLLKAHVSEGWVDYPGIIAEADAFYGYTRMLGTVTEADLRRWSREQKLAYWVNAYNAFTIQAIIERYPIRERSIVGLFFPQNSILQISGIWSRLRFDAGGRPLTLNDIEHDILRKEFDEPRIHFAIVCASRSCPKLRPEAFRHDVLDNQLHEQAVEFINDPFRGVRWEAASRRLFISKIFKWFKKDFAGTSDSAYGNPLLDTIMFYIEDTPIREAIAKEEKIRITYLPYDWHLNERGPSGSPGGKDD